MSGGTAPAPAACDALVVGGGPAGLTAAIYLARFHLTTVVVDAGRSRASTIPRTRNHAGYPGGVAGADLVAAMRAQAAGQGARLVVGHVETLAQDDDGFVATWDGGTLRAAAVVLATGVVNRRPPIDDALHDAALAAGALRYCPVCDGFEVTDARVAVLGTGEHGVREALFLRSYTADLTLIAPDGPHALDAGERARLAEAGIAAVDGPARGYRLVDGGLALTAGEGARELTFASLYPALGSHIRSGLAASLGAATADAGCVTVDDHQRTTVPGLYAAGDVVVGLDQISHAMGEGGVAATTLRNDLAERRRLWR
ncbi:MAG: NAD(P)/FAD-dependent oxidoreductase [Sphingomonadaceae bacterium]|nr:NAD(P)/FAD-dependent oxidoreductase [Sphingomonadaceae bacterium]